MQRQEGAIKPLIHSSAKPPMRFKGGHSGSTGGGQSHDRARSSSCLPMSRSAVAEPPVLPMTRAEYYAWVGAQPRGRYERINGIVVERDGASAMAPECAIHN